MKSILKTNNYMFFFLLLMTISIYADADSGYKGITLYIHVVNEKFSSNNPNLRESVDRFLKEVWQEAIAKKVSDIQEINKIAYEKLNKQHDTAKSLYENGLRFADNTYSPTSNYDVTLSTIARLRDHGSGQEHPLIIVFSNYALEMRDLINLQFKNVPSQENVLSFEVSSKSKELNGKSPQDIFYEWTSSFAEDKIIGTEKEKYSRGNGWRMAVLVNDTVFSVPSLRAPLRNGACIGGRFTELEIQRLEADLDISLSEEFSYDHECAKSEQQETEFIVFEDYLNNLRLKRDNGFFQVIERIEQGLKNCKEPELRVFFEEMIILIHAMMDLYNLGDQGSEMQAVNFRWKELFRKYQGKFDFDFQKNLIITANMFWHASNMYEVQDLGFRKEIVLWAEDLVKKFPNESSSYAVLGSIKAMNGSKKDEVLPILKKGLALDKNNQDCLSVMKNIDERD